MKMIVPTSIFLLSYSLQTFAGVGTGKVLDIDIRISDTMLFVKVENNSSTPTCSSTWNHKFGTRFDGIVTSNKLYAMLLSAQATGNTVRIAGSGSCLPGTGAEEIMELNIGPWGQ